MIRTTTKTEITRIITRITEVIRTTTRTETTKIITRITIRITEITRTETTTRISDNPIIIQLKGWVSVTLLPKSTLHIFMSFVA